MKLFPFQQRDLARLIPANNLLISYRMGFGKTPLAIEIDKYRRQTFEGDPFYPLQKTLVVCPLSAFGVWEQHFKDWNPALHVTTINPKSRGDFLKNPQGQVFIVHYDALRLMPELGKGGIWNHIIADEVHRIQNRKAQVTRALKEIPSRYRTGLSGTPCTNTPDRLWSILHWLYPKVWTSYWRFFNNFVDYKVNYYGYKEIVGVRNERHLLREIAPYFIRRQEGDPDVLADLAEFATPLQGRYYSKRVVVLGPKQRKAYDQMRKDMLAWVGNWPDEKPIAAPVAIAKMVRLQQFSATYADVQDDGSVQMTWPSAKLDALMDDINDSQEQLVVFSMFKGTLRLLAAALDDEGITYAIVTGDDSNPQHRRESVERFQSGDARIFLGTIAAAGEAITLTAASTVYFTDRDWSPSINDQAESRLYRAGQPNMVHVIDLIGKDTIDLGKEDRLSTKKEWHRRLLGDK